jgi:hypothetical protein
MPTVDPTELSVHAEYKGHSLSGEERQVQPDGTIFDRLQQLLAKVDIGELGRLKAYLRWQGASSKLWTGPSPWGPYLYAALKARHPCMHAVL